MEEGVGSRCGNLAREGGVHDLVKYLFIMTVNVTPSLIRLLFLQFGYGLSLGTFRHHF